MNVQPSEGEVGYDVRVPPTVNIEFLRKRLDEEWAPVIRNLTYEVEFYILFSCGCSTSFNCYEIKWWFIFNVVRGQCDNQY